MKKMTLMLLAIVLLLNTKVVAQANQNCTNTYNLFKGEVQTKKIRCGIYQAPVFNE